MAKVKQNSLLYKQLQVPSNAHLEIKTCLAIKLLKSQEIDGFKTEHMDRQSEV